MSDMNVLKSLNSACVWNRWTCSEKFTGKMVQILVSFLELNRNGDLIVSKVQPVDEHATNKVTAIVSRIRKLRSKVRLQANSFLRAPKGIRRLYQVVLLGAM